MVVKFKGLHKRVISIEELFIASCKVGVNAMVEWLNMT